MILVVCVFCVCTILLYYFYCFIITPFFITQKHSLFFF